MQSSLHVVDICVDGVVVEDEERRFRCSRDPQLHGTEERLTARGRSTRKEKLTGAETSARSSPLPGVDVLRTRAVKQEERLWMRPERSPAARGPGREYARTCVGQWEDERLCGATAGASLLKVAAVSGMKRRPGSGEERYQ